MTNPDPEWMLPDRMRGQAARGEGVFGAYDAFAAGTDARAIEHHAVVDDAYARLYAGNLLGHLRALGLRPDGPLLDAGCAIGTLTDALRAGLGEGSTADGIDLSETAIRVAETRYPCCRFAVLSADDLGRFPDRHFALIHARGVLPVHPQR